MTTSRPDPRSLDPSSPAHPAPAPPEIQPAISGSGAADGSYDSAKGCLVLLALAALAIVGILVLAALFGDFE